MTAALHLPDLLRDKQDWTVDDLANLPDDLRYELIDGRLILPSPTFMHQDICGEVMLMLRPNCPPGFRVVIDVSLAVDPRNEPRPDVVVARKAAGVNSYWSSIRRSRRVSCLPSSASARMASTRR